MKLNLRWVTSPGCPKKSQTNPTLASIRLPEKLSVQLRKGFSIHLKQASAISDRTLGRLQKTGRSKPNGLSSSGEIHQNNAAHSLSEYLKPPPLPQKKGKTITPGPTKQLYRWHWIPANATQKKKVACAMCRFTSRCNFLELLGYQRSPLSLPNP